MLRDALEGHASTPHMSFLGEARLPVVLRKYGFVRWFGGKAAKRLCFSDTVFRYILDDEQHSVTLAVPST